MLCSVGEVLEGIHITMPYSIASYMVRDFLREGSPDGTVDEQLVGTLTGVLVSPPICVRWDICHEKRLSKSGEWS